MSINQYVYSGQGFFITSDDAPFFKQVVRIIEHHRNGEKILEDLGNADERYQLPMMVEFLNESSSFSHDFPNLAITALQNNWDGEYDKILIVFKDTVKCVFDKYASLEEYSFYLDTETHDDSEIESFLKVFSVKKKVRPVIWTKFM